MTETELLFWIEGNLNLLLRDIHPSKLNWDENHITFSLMNQLQTAVNWFGPPLLPFGKTISIKCFKNPKRKIENKFGDISIIIRTQHNSGKVVNGVANLEAKRIFSGSYSFDSIKLNQLKNIRKNLPFSHLLLYDFRKPSVNLTAIDFAIESGFYTLPINTVLSLGSSNKELIGYDYTPLSMPFSYFICARLLKGYDLDYREIVIDQITSGTKAEELPEFVAIVDVVEEIRQMPQIIMSDVWQQLRFIG